MYYLVNFKSVITLIVLKEDSVVYEGSVVLKCTWAY